MKRLFAAIAALAVSAAFAIGAVNIPLVTGPQDPSQLNASLNALITQINSGITQQSTANSFASRNILDNGAINFTQRGTAAATCGTTSGLAITSYSADRWGCDVNVSSGAGQLSVTTSSPTPPIGFVNQLQLVRNSGILTQPQCIWQEIPTQDARGLQGQTVLFSAYLAALANLSADNGNVVTFVLITGTGTDQGFGTLRSAVGMTASPAITPVWTGLATLQSANVTISTAYARYNAPAVQVPTTVTEMAAGICFTPTAAAVAGSTDGFVATGIQLEPVTPSLTASITNTPSAFEFRNKNTELPRLQRFFQILTEPAANVLVPVQGSSLSATVANMAYGFPTVMDVAPTFTALGTALSGSTWKNNCGNVANALATTFIVTNTANTVAGASLTVTSSGSTIGFGCTLVGAGGGSILSWSADF